MKVGTDGVLLGAWADLGSAERVLDIGTGTGLIALICAQRLPAAQVTALEIDPEAAAQAGENVAASSFADRVQVLHTALQDYHPEHRYDIIICNPPFFSGGSSSPQPAREQARHGVSLSLDQLMLHAQRLGTDDARIHLVLPIDRREDLLRAAQAHGWHLARETTVYPNAQRPAKRILISAARSPQTPVFEKLVIEGESRFSYTPDYARLTAAFYPKVDYPGDGPS